MNILYIAYSCSPFLGSEDKIGWCVPYESSKTNRVWVITKEEQRKPIEKYLKEHRLENIEFYYIDIPEVYKKVFKGFLYSGRLNAWNRRVFTLVKRICSENKVDIIHQITPIEFRAIGDYGKIADVKFVCGPLGAGQRIPQGLKDYAIGHEIIEIVRTIVNYLFRFKLKVTGKLNRCDYIMFANKETQEFLGGGWNCPSELVFDNGLRTDELVKTESVEDRNMGKNITYKESMTEVVVGIKDNKIDKTNNCCTFLVVGRMLYIKGLDFLFDALSRISETSNYQVIIVGDGPELFRLRKRCKRDKNLKQHVQFTGKVPYFEMEREYAKADVLIMPSIRESTGTVLLEAISKGIPVITINKFGGATLIDENTGWLYDGSDKESYIENLKRAILECIYCPDEVKRRGINARIKAENYTWQEKNKKYQKIYENLLKSDSEANKNQCV
ncbi:MAG: glycosyltransferase family 4 protein [Clostridiaceae bacterium]|nr:glycosyltransferase family 4 protein [Clostridiaceae bacterium]